MTFAHSNKRDSNEPDIVQALLGAGATVTRLGDSGVPDLLVGYRGKTYLLEVKLPLGPRGGKSARREHEGGRGDMTAAQVKWWDAWTGEAPVIVRNVDEALAAIGARA